MYNRIALMQRGIVLGLGKEDTIIKKALFSLSFFFVVAHLELRTHP